jgi:hypothetical protein
VSRVPAVALVTLVAAVACTPVAPPPTLPRHMPTAPSGEEPVFVTIVTGVGLEGLGGTALGGELRVTKELASGTSLGVGLTVASVGVDDFAGDHWWFALRGFGAYSPQDATWSAVGGGVGVGVLTSGLVTLTLDGGAAVAYDNDVAIPTLELDAALSLVLRPGAGFGKEEKLPQSELWIGGSLGVGLDLDGSHYPSLAATFFWGAGHGEVIEALSVGDSIVR